MAIRTAPKTIAAAVKAITNGPSAADVRAAIADAVEAEANAARVGRPPSGKVVVSIRLDPDVIAAFRATGPGWQARINEILRKCAP